MVSVLRGFETQIKSPTEAFQLESRDAVASACMASCWQLTSSYMGLLSKESKPDSSVFEYAREQGPGRIVSEATRNKCWYGSIRTLDYLQQTQPDRFVHLFLLKGVSTTEKNLRNGWGCHYYAVAQDTTGRYFAVSPANHTQDSQDSLTSIIEGNNMDEVANQISLLNGGLWPTGDQVVKSLQDKYIPPTVTDTERLPSEYRNIQVLTIDHDYAETERCRVGGFPHFSEIIDFRRRKATYQEVTEKANVLFRSETNLKAESLAADAMIVAYSTEVQRYVAGAKFGPLSESPVENMASSVVGSYVESATRNRCRDYSIRALAFLTQKSPSLFSQMFLLESWSNGKNPFKNGNFGYHTYFVVRDVGGRYYAGSPANHSTAYTRSLEKPGRTTSEKSPLEDVLISDSLQDIIDAIEDRDGGSWPLAADVEAAGLNNPLFKTPQLTESEGYCSLSAVCMVRPTTGGVDARIHTGSFKSENTCQIY